MNLLRQQANPIKISSTIIEAELPDVKIGEVCEISQSLVNGNIIAKAQVVGFQNERTILCLIGQAKGLSRSSVLKPTGTTVTIEVGDFMLGSVVSASGEIVESFEEQDHNNYLSESRPIDILPPEYFSRKTIDTPFITHIKAIDGLITCGLGQRIGIFASAGCGKTSLMKMIIEQSVADVFVVGLIGERGREVTEFVDSLKKSPKAKQCVVVYATSDYSSLDRCNAALKATTIAEYFRDQGKNVVLFLDSITRYARALRDVSLASGESPARRGYPASVFDTLPKVLERPGNMMIGSITAFYTILLESDDEPDPIAEEIRSILDGHIYLNRKLAAKNHYPAIDILRSQSRIFNEVTSPEHQFDVGVVRSFLAKIEELQMLVDFGEYKEGENLENDKAMQKKDTLISWLQQKVDDSVPFNVTLRNLHEFTE